jgi:ABC-type branched-subunit amino acid transport system permease subunit
MDSPVITAHDLRLLSIGYYIQAGIAGFYTLMMLGYSAFATVLFANINKMAGQANQQEIPPALLSIISILLAVVLGVCCAYTLCMFLAGYWLRHRRNKLFIQVLAAFNCLAIPYGTVLGIFTFMVLQRPSAKQLFAEPGAPPPPPLPTAAEPPAL